MPRRTDVERQLAAFAATLVEETSGPIIPTSAPNVAVGTPEGSGSRRWLRVLVGAAAGVLAVLAGVAVVSRDPQPNPGPSTNTTAPPAPTVATTPDAATSLEVVDRYRFDPNGMRIFPSPDGRWYLDEQGCVAAVAAGSLPACPDEELTVEHAAWAADSRLVAFDQPAFRFASGSGIVVASIDSPSVDPGTPAPVTFERLTGDTTPGQSGNIDVMPLVLDDEIRFLRLREQQPDATFEIVAVDLQGTETSTAETDLAVSSLASTRAVLVDDGHVLLGRRSDTQNQLLTIAADGTIEMFSQPDETAVVVDGNSNRAAVFFFAVGIDAGVGGDPPAGRIRVFDGGHLDATDLVVTADGSNSNPVAVDFSREGTSIVAAYSSDTRDSITLSVWDTEHATVSDLGTVPVDRVRALRWFDDDRLVIFTDDEILEVVIRSP